MKDFHKSPTQPQLKLCIIILKHQLGFHGHTNKCIINVFSLIQREEAMYVNSTHGYLML